MKGEENKMADEKPDQSQTQEQPAPPNPVLDPKVGVKPQLEQRDLANYRTKEVSGYITKKQE